jgi:type III pantothenate kinase
MLLTIDLGNTETVFGMYEKDTLTCHWRISSKTMRTADESGLLLHQLLRSADFRAAQIEGIVIASVVPALTDIFLEMSERIFNITPLIISHEVHLNITLNYRDPSQIGADRIANAAGSFRKYSKAAIVVDLGTATTFDVITENGEYLGGVIAPGILASANMLFEKAARLFRVRITRPPRTIGVNTEESIQSGIYYGTVGQIDEINRRIISELGFDPVIVATGGFAQAIEKDSSTITEIDPWLTLYGLKILYELNRAG